MEFSTCTPARTKRYVSWVAVNTVANHDTITLTLNREVACFDTNSNVINDYDWNIAFQVNFRLINEPTANFC